MFDLSDEITRPGFMLYNENYATFKEMSGDDVKKMVIAAFEYTMFGVIPEFDGLLLRTVWIYMQPKLDHDGKKYRYKVLSSKYANYCKEAGKQQQETELLSFDEWKACCYPTEPVGTDGNRSVPDGAGRNLNITGTIKETIDLTTTGKGAGKGTATRGAGEEGEGEPATVQPSPTGYECSDSASTKAKAKGAAEYLLAKREGYTN